VNAVLPSNLVATGGPRDQGHINETSVWEMQHLSQTGPHHEDVQGGGNVLKEERFPANGEVIPSYITKA
jgi:hypothetical protein